MYFPDLYAILNVWPLTISKYSIYFCCNLFLCRLRLVFEPVQQLGRIHLGRHKLEALPETISSPRKHDHGDRLHLFHILLPLGLPDQIQISRSLHNGTAATCAGGLLTVPLPFPAVREFGLQFLNVRRLTEASRLPKNNDFIALIYTILIRIIYRLTETFLCLFLESKRVGLSIGYESNFFNQTYNFS